jgi:hypothetical protein
MSVVLVRTLRHALVLATLSAALPSQAGEVYLGLGAPGVTLGYAHPTAPTFAVRGEASTLGTRKDTRTEDGIRYDARLKTERFSVLGDWFVGGAGFRFTGGLASQNYKLSLDGSGAGGTLTVGGTTYTTTSADGLLVEVKAPSFVPYLGLGWGHHDAKGWRFAFDLGAYIGKAKVSVTPRGQLAQPAAQADVDAEVAELRDGVGKVRVLPQLGVSVGFSF